MGTGQGPRLRMPYYKVYQFLQQGSYDADADEKELKRVTQDEQKWRYTRTRELNRMERARVNGHYCLGMPSHQTLVQHQCPYRRDIDGSGDGCLCCDTCRHKCQDDADTTSVNDASNWSKSYDWSSNRSSASTATDNYFYVDTTTGGTGN